MLNFKKIYTLFKASCIDGWLGKKESEILYNLSKKYIIKGGIAAEIGSWKGKSSYIIASVCRDKRAKLICIDTFSGSKFSNKPDNIENDAYYEARLNPNKFFQNNIKKNLKGLPVIYLKMTSNKACKHIKNKSLDFCFIDGDHTMPVVFNDIENYLKKVKPGGVLLGHDYNSEYDPKNYVKHSVDKIIGAESIKLYHSIWVYELKS